MPTFDLIDTHGETDMGWAIARVSQRHPVTHQPTSVIVQCKACQVTFEYTVDRGGVASGFDHLPTCPIYQGIHDHTVHEIHRPRS